MKLNCCITPILPEETAEFTSIEINEENVIDLYYKKMILLFIMKHKKNV